MSGKRGSFVANSISLLKQTFSEWLEDKVPQLGAALAYYTVFSLAPLVLLLLAIVGFLFHNDPAGAWRKMTEQMSYFLDKSAIDVVARYRAESVATEQGFPGDNHWNFAGTFRRERRLWPVARCAQHYLGRKSKTWRRNRRIYTLAFSLLRHGGRCLFFAAGLSRARKRAQKL